MLYNGLAASLQKQESYIEIGLLFFTVSERDGSPYKDAEEIEIALYIYV